VPGEVVIDGNNFIYIQKSYQEHSESKFVHSINFGQVKSVQCKNLARIWGETSLKFKKFHQKLKCGSKKNKIE